MQLKISQKLLIQVYSCDDTGGFSEMALTVLVGVVTLYVNDNKVSQLPNTQRAIP